MTEGSDRLADDRDVVKLRRRSVQGTLVTFAAQGIRFVVQFGCQVLLANLLLPGDFGLVAMVTPLLYLVQVFNELGLMQATVQREEISHQQLTALFWVNMLISILLAGAMLVLAPLVAKFYGEPRLTAVTISLSAVIILGALSAQHMALLTRRMKLIALSCIDVACITVASGAGLYAARLGAHYWALVVMQAANMATIAIFAWLLSGFRPGRPRRMVGVGALLRFGGQVAGHNIVTFAGYNIPSILIGLFYNSTLLGLYDRSFRLVIVPLWQLNAPLDRVGTALLSRLRTNEAQFTRVYYLMLQLLMSLTAPGFVWAAIMADVLVPTMLGKVWNEAAPIVAWLSISALTAPITMSTYWVFVSQGRSQEQLRNSLIRNGLVVVSLVAGLHWGPLGVAASAACFAPLINGIAIWGVTRRGPVTTKGFARALYPICLGAPTSAVTLYLIIHFFLRYGFSTAAFLPVTLLLSYVVCGLVMVCTPEGLQMLRNASKLRSTLRSSKYPSGEGQG